MEEYRDYTLVGVLNGSSVYNHPMRGISVERDHRYLGSMTENEKTAWEQQQQDKVMLARLEEERERADRIFARCDLGRYVSRYEQPGLSRQAAEDWYTEVGKAMAQGSSDVPKVV